MDHKQNEAITAKKLAEGMLKNNDYSSAKIFASLSQRLYPELEGISQMCTMLDVFVSSEQRINGHANWYGVLSVDPKADDAAIKKQFKKLALVLHPDKNRSVGAEDAFKLVSEAKDILLDKQRRSDYDRATGLGARAPPQADGPSAPMATRPTPRRAYAYGPWPPTGRSSWNAARPSHTVDPWARARGPTEHTSRPWAHSTGPSSHKSNPCPPTGDPPAQTGGPSADTGGPSAQTGGPSAQSTEGPRFTFASWARGPKAPCRPDTARPRTQNLWTICHRCKVQFELPRLYRNVVIVCANCSRAFLAVEVPRPTGKTRRHKPKPWPKLQQSDYLRFAEVNARAWKNPFENAPDQWGPLFGTGAGFDGGKPSTAAEAAATEEEKAAAHYTEADVLAGIEGFFKRKRMNDGGRFGNNQNVGQGSEGGFGLGPMAYGFTGLV
ncbi:protein hlj1 [Phtheirospermum japonicum]|uniref:Protein hlj1 n=1 Tax=Phtheirospermum japonicum TaxID=374723 RepID=A0A830C7P2_9LAMI|nr:protein hlj1 [Phtheirospermum japonicum]